MKKHSWKTTLFGAGGLAAVAFTAISALLDGDPTTNPDWNILITASLPAIGLLFSRDNNVTSEQAGAK